MQLTLALRETRRDSRMENRDFLGYKSDLHRPISQLQKQGWKVVRLKDPPVPHAGRSANAVSG